MTDEKSTKETSGGCCEGPDFTFPTGMRKEMSRMMEQFCGEGGSFDCSRMMEMMDRFRREDGSVDCSQMMKAMSRMFNQEREETGSD